MNTQQYVDEVLRIIKDVFRPSDPSGSMPVATAAYLVKQSLGLEHTTFGFAKFKDVLAELEKQGAIRTGTNSKNAYALWILGDSTAPPPTATLATYSAFRPLRNHIWFAFVSALPPGRRFLERDTGEVRVGLQEAPDGNWAEIIPVEPATEKAEAEQFLTKHQLDSNAEVTRSLSSEKWYFEFPRALSRINPQLATEWKRLRSTRVVAQVEKWGNENGVPTQLIFEQERPRTLESPGPRQTSGLRQVLLAAIGRMTTEQLLELQIPPRLLIGAARSDLLDG